MPSTRTLRLAACIALLLLAALPALATEIRFAPGTSGATIEGAVIRGERVQYTLKASRGQSMHVRIRSIEDNAVFQLYRPGGALISRQEARSWSGTLPASGRYLIEVGGTRGNATFTLSVEIH